MLPLDGGAEIALVKHPANDLFQGLAPDGENILFSSDRDGSTGLYLTRIENGLPSGDPHLLKSDIGQIEALGFKPSGAFYYTTQKELSDVYMAKLDASGYAHTPLEKMETRFQGNNRLPVYSPDGTYLAYISVMQPSIVNFNRGGGNMLVIRSLEAKQEQRIIPELHQIGYPCWSPDSKHIMVVDFTENNTMGLHQIDIQSGQVKTIISPDEGLSLFGKHEYSPDGATLYYGKMDMETRVRKVMSRDLESGAEKTLYESKKFLQITLSPDGLWLAVNSRDLDLSTPRAAMLLLPTSGGEVKDLITSKEGEGFYIGFHGFCTWTIDGKYILFGRIVGPAGNIICRVPASGGEIEKIGVAINNISNLKELTEKRIQEEQKNLALTLSDHFEEEITDLAEKFSDYWDRHNIGQADGMMLMDTFVLIEQVFLLDDYGNFIWPWFIDGFENRNIRKSPARFHTNFDQGERAEFIEKDFSKANSKYLSALRASTNNLDSVQSLNALARLSVKKEDGKQAFIYYSSIISKFPGICDSHGFPYVYYAMPQLIRISNTKNRDQILQEMQSCLVGMEDGRIPLNQSSLNILKQVNDWIDVESNSNTLINKLKESIQKIRYRLSFIDRNKEVIREYLRTDNKNIFPRINIEYHALNGPKPNGGELVLINDNDEYARGFSILIEQLWAKSTIGNLISGTEFEYELELGQIGNRTNASESPHATFFEISTYFPGYYVLIKLQEESLIDEFVKRRSWIYGIALTMLLGGMVLGILLILRDISREAHLAQLRADFISNVTHELKTPLTSIQLFTESIALKRIKTAAQKKEYLQIILKETESLKRMINNILDSSREGRGKREYHFKEVNISAQVNTAIEDLEYWLTEKKFTLHKEIDEHIVAKADPVALKQAIINLLNNAIKFSVDRKEIVVSLKRAQENILIQVEDKGIGIPDDQKDLIFQAFYRVGQKNSEDISGTGLGLSVVKEIVEAHQGTVSVESRVNEGSTFTIILNASQENLE